MGSSSTKEDNNNNMLTKLYDATLKRKGVVGGYVGNADIGTLTSLTSNIGIALRQAKEDIIRNLAQDFKSELNLQVKTDGSLEEIIASMKSVVPNPKTKQTTITDKESPQVKMCVGMAKIINKRYGTEVVSERAAPEQICSQVGEIMYSLFSSIHAEYISLKLDINRVLENIAVLQRYLKQIYSESMNKIAPLQSDSNKADVATLQGAYDEINKYLENEVLMLNNMVNATIDPMDKNLMNLVKDNESFHRISKSLKDAPGSQKFGDKLAFVLGEMEANAVLLTLVKKAMDKIGMTLEDYDKAKTLDELKDKLTELRTKQMSSPDAYKTMISFAQAADLLSKYHFNHAKIVEELKAKKGGIEVEDEYDGEIKGGKLRLDKRIEIMEGAKNLIFEQFNREIAKKLESFTTHAKAVAKKFGRDIPQSKQLFDFISAFYELPDMRRKSVYLALTGYNKDTSSVSLKEGFLAAIRNIVYRMAPFCDGSALQDKSLAEHFNAMKADLEFIADRIKLYSEQFERGLSLSDIQVDEYSGGADYMGPELSSETMNLNQVKEDMWIYFRSGQFKINLENASKEHVHYNVDYQKMLGQAIAAKISAIVSEKDTLEKNSPKPALVGTEYFKKFYETKVQFWKTAEAIDLLLLNFIDAIGKNPEDLKEVKRMLEEVKINAHWFNNQAGDNLCNLFESFGGNQKNNKDVHYYEEIIKSSFNATSSGSISANDIEKAIKTAQSVVDNFSVLKNIISIFVSIGNKFGNTDVMKEAYMSPKTLYENLSQYVYISSFTQANDGKLYLNKLDDIQNKDLKFKEEDELFPKLIKSMFAKVCTAVGVFDNLNRPEFIELLSPARLIIGGAQWGGEEYPTIKAELAELYIRLPLLAEFYAKIFDPKEGYGYRQGNAATDKSISIIPDIDGVFRQFIEMMFNKMYDVREGTYSEMDVKTIVQEINNIYVKYGNKENICELVIKDFIAEVNRRYGVLTRSEFTKWTQARKSYLESDDTTYTTELRTNAPILPFENNPTYTKSLPSDKYGFGQSLNFSNATSDNKIEMTDYDMVQKFMNNVNKFVDESKQSIYDDKTKGVRTSFRDIIRQTVDEVKLAKENKDKFDIVMRVVKGADKFSNINSIKLTMLHEALNVPLQTIESINIMLETFDAKIKSFDFVRCVMEWLSDNRNQLLTAGNVNPLFVAKNIHAVQYNIINGFANIYSNNVQVDGTGKFVNTAAAPNNLHGGLFGLLSVKGSTLDDVFSGKCVEELRAITQMATAWSVVYPFVFDLISSHASDLNNMVEIRVNEDSLSLDYSNLRDHIQKLIEATKKNLVKFTGIISVQKYEEYQTYIVKLEKKLKKQLEYNDRFTSDKREHKFTVHDSIRHLTEGLFGFRYNTAAVDANNVPTSIIIGAAACTADSKLIKALDQKSFAVADTNVNIGNALETIVNLDVNFNTVQNYSVNTLNILYPLAKNVDNADFECSDSTGAPFVQNNLTEFVNDQHQISGLVIKFNQIISDYIRTFTDPSQFTMYNTVINGFINSVYSQTISVKQARDGTGITNTIGDTVPIQQNILQNSKNTLAFSNKAALHGLYFKLMKGKTIKQHITINMADVPMYMRETYKAQMPLFKSILTTFINKCVLLKNIIDKSAYSGMNNIDDRKKQLSDMISGANSLRNCCIETLKELEDRPVYFQLSDKSFEDFATIYGKKPFMPYSSIATCIKTKSISYTASSGTTEFKLSYGIRSLLEPKQLSMDYMPGVKDILDAYNGLSDPRNSISAEDYLSMLQVNHSLLSYVIRAKNMAYKIAYMPEELHIHQDFAGQSFNNGTNVPFVYQVSQTVDEVVKNVESVNQEKNREKIVEYLNVNADLKPENRAKVQYMNILDMNIVPVDFNALRRDIPLINIYNCSCNADSMISELFLQKRGLDNFKNKKVDSVKELFVKLLVDPYTTVDFKIVEDIFRGRTGMALRRPKFLGEQMFNKVLLHELYPQIQTKDRNANKSPQDVDPKGYSSQNKSIIYSEMAPGSIKNRLETILQRILISRVSKSILKELIVQVLNEMQYEGTDANNSWGSTTEKAAKFIIDIMNRIYNNNYAAIIGNAAACLARLSSANLRAALLSNLTPVAPNPLGLIPGSGALLPVVFKFKSFGTGLGPNPNNLLKPYTNATHLNEMSEILNLFRGLYLGVVNVIDNNIQLNAYTSTISGIDHNTNNFVLNNLNVQSNWNTQFGLIAAATTNSGPYGNGNFANTWISDITSKPLYNVDFAKKWVDPIFTKNSYDLLKSYDIDMNVFSYVYDVDMGLKLSYPNVKAQGIDFDEDSLKIEEVQLVSNKYDVYAEGEARFNTKIIRNLFFMTNLHRALSYKLSTELNQYRDIPQDLQALDPRITEFYGHQMGQEYRPTY